MPVAQIGFLFHTRSLKGNVVKKQQQKTNMFFNQKSQIFEIFQKCILDTDVSTFQIIKTVLQLNEPVRWVK